MPRPMRRVRWLAAARMVEAEEMPRSRLALAHPDAVLAERLAEFDQPKRILEARGGVIVLVTSGHEEGEVADLG